MVIFIGLIFTNCSKDTPYTDPNECRGIQNESEAFLQKVKHFINIVDQQSKGVTLKSEDKISIDSAIFYIGATFNYKYCFANSSFSLLNKYEIDLTFPVEEDEKVLVDNVINAYNDAIDSVIVKYRSISDTTKKIISFSVINTGIDALHNQGIRVIAKIGTGNRIASVLDQNGYFGLNEWYYYLDQTHNCYDNSGQYGAPDILDMELNNIYKEVAPPGYRYIYWPTITTFFDYSDYRTPLDELNNHCDYLIYYASSAVGTLTGDTECLKYNQLDNGIHEMDHYFYGMQSIIDEWLFSNQYKHYVVCETNAYYIPGPPVKFGHEFSVEIGNRIIEYPQNNNYPIPIE